MSEWLFLSHVLSEETPMYGGREGIKLEATSCICNGDAANSLYLKFPNHIGTHIDAPKHFVDDGNTVDAFSPDFWSFDRPMLVDCPKDPDGLIGPEDVDLAAAKELAPDILLFRTGFEAKRQEKVFWENNPGVSPEMGPFLKEALPSVRVIGMDVISVNRWQDRPTGRVAHKNLLGREGGEPVLIIEDMKLSVLESGRQLQQLIVAPLLIRQADGGPCTVMGRY